MTESNGHGMRRIERGERWIIGFVILNVIVIALLVVFHQRTSATREEEMAEAVRAAPRFPIAQVDEQAIQAGLTESDDLVLAELMTAVGPKGVRRFIIPRNIVRRVVATVDSLPRSTHKAEERPITAPSGQPIVLKQRGVLILSSKNHHRYTPHVHALQGTHPELITRAYVMFYPLFQQAYEELGNQGKYFNDRLVDVIDHLLDTPEVDTPLELVRAGAHYAFRDPSLEKLSTGQKLILRMGPEHARIVKMELRVLRREIIERSPPASLSPDVASEVIASPAGP